MTDRTGRSVAVNLYNLAPGKGVIIGDSVAIAEPYFTRVSVAPSSFSSSSEAKSIEFGLIRVESPLVLVINGKKAGRDMVAGIELSTVSSPTSSSS